MPKTEINALSDQIQRKEERPMFGKVKTAEELAKLYAALSDEEKAKFNGLMESEEEPEEPPEEEPEKVEETTEPMPEKVEETPEEEKPEIPEEPEEVEDKPEEVPHDEAKEQEVIEALAARLTATEESLAKLQEQIDAMADKIDHKEVGMKPEPPMADGDKDTMSPIERGYFAKANYRR